MRKNKEKGSWAEDKLYSVFSCIMDKIEAQITIKVNGEDVKIRADAIGLEKTSDGEDRLKILEFKSSKTAPLTKNQKVGFPALTEKGGVVVRNKTHGVLFPDGYIIPPGTVIEVIRVDEGGNWYVSDRFG